jgi:hypothetical protein
MRTTITLDDSLLLDVKRLAAESGRTMSAVIEDALRESLARRRKAVEQEERVELPTFRGTGVAPGVDLNSWASLLDVMEEEEEEEEENGRR